MLFIMVSEQGYLQFARSDHVSQPKNLPMTTCTCKDPSFIKNPPHALLLSSSSFPVHPTRWIISEGTSGRIDLILIDLSSNFLLSILRWCSVRNDFISKGVNKWYRKNVITLFEGVCVNGRVTSNPWHPFERIVSIHNKHTWEFQRMSKS